MRRYGQIFLKDSSIARTIVDSFDIKSTDNIVEIGPGKRALTRYILASSYGSFTTVDIDKRMYMDSTDRHIHIHADFLKLDLSRLADRFRIITNLPFCITKLFFMKIINEGFSRVTDMTVMLQYEFKDNFLFTTTAFSRFVNSFYIIEPLIKVDRKSFYPVPDVDAIVLRFSPRKFDIDRAAYFNFLCKLYTNKRKVLRNNTVLGIIVDSSFVNFRAEALSSEQVITLYDRFKSTYK